MQKVNFYDQGEVSEVYIDSVSVDNFSHALLLNISEVLRLNIDSIYMNEIKTGERSMEIHFGEGLNVQTNYLGKMKIDRIFIPLTGDLAGTKDSPVATVLISENGEYISTPYRAPTGFTIIDQFVKEITHR